MNATTSLPDFIDENVQTILAEWERFASTIPSASALDTEGLRDHAEQILHAVAADMRTEQSDTEREAKSKGQALRRDAADTAAELHGSGRLEEGFTLNEMVSEYRALRASVVHLWLSGPGNEQDRTLSELTRFHEALDQSLSESIARFSANLDKRRQLFMGTLGHDLRTHLHVILASSSKLRSDITMENVQRYGSYIDASAQQINHMVIDLLDVARTKLGGQLPLDPAPVNAAMLCEETVRPFLILHPDRRFIVEAPDDIQGNWDKQRLQQLIANLIRNALQYGHPQSPITLGVSRAEGLACFRVHNEGKPIPTNKLHLIFEPMQRAAEQSLQQTGDTNVGLGLYIARTIARAHGGQLSVESSQEHGTTFTASLPL